MGTALRLRQPEQPVAAFDFDGTLTVRDSFNAFLRWRSGRRRFVRLIPEALAYAGHRDRGRIKAEAVRVFLGGVGRHVLERDAEAFAAENWHRLMRPDALSRWREHQAAGDLCVIVTASPEATVAPFARRLGADLLLGTPLVFSAGGRVVGMDRIENCRGEEKVRRLREAFGPDVRLAAAYGDTSGDREMLEIAERPGFRVFKGRPRSSSSAPPPRRAPGRARPR
jgi:phosphatidylglycerophosphatase C